jgi:hypothetical protein
MYYAVCVLVYGVGALGGARAYLRISIRARLITIDAIMIAWPIVGLVMVPHYAA